MASLSLIFLSLFAVVVTAHVIPGYGYGGFPGPSPFGAMGGHQMQGPGMGALGGYGLGHGLAGLGGGIAGGVANGLGGGGLGSLGGLGGGLGNPGIGTLAGNSLLQGRYPGFNGGGSNVRPGAFMG